TLGSYQIQGVLAHNGPSNPTLKAVLHVPASWMAVTPAGSWLWVAVGLALVGALGTVLLRKTPVLAFLSSALVPISTITTAGLALFPFLLPSSQDPSAGLTIWDASSSKLTLGIMLGAVVIFLPIIIAYTSWVYYVMRGPVRSSDITQNSKTAY
ncbi:MAG: cytochrome d ubiquinol oxidase subunit II, partial [Alphaproteobacteria bacterium]|nr:cytochrome d ubiquinol oxidase subunit II [Alphaproteobacteria bacterium]